MKHWTAIILENYPAPGELQPGGGWEPVPGGKSRECEVMENAKFVLFEYGRVNFCKREVSMTHYHGGFKQEHLREAAGALWVAWDEAMRRLRAVIAEAMYELQRQECVPDEVLLPASYHAVYPHTHLLGLKVLPLDGRRNDSSVRVYSEDRGGGRWVTLPIEQ